MHTLDGWLQAAMYLLDFGFKVAASWIHHHSAEYKRVGGMANISA